MNSRHSKGFTGFTLLEILLVLVLLSLTAFVVVPTLPQSNKDEGKQEAERFYQLMKRWNEHSLLSGDVMGVRVDDEQYQLLMLGSEGTWLPVHRDRWKTLVTMPEGIELRLNVMDEENTSLFEQNDFYEDLFTDPDAERAQKTPQIILMGNGEVLPFTLSFMTGGDVLWEVVGNDLGEFTLVAPNEDKE